MKNKSLKYFIRPIILLSSFTFCLSPQLFGQPQFENSEKTEISGGAEYSIYLEKLIKSGNRWMVQYDGKIPRDPLYKTDVITTIEGINFDENASNSGSYSIPPDPHGAAGPNHLVSVVNTSIEWFTKAGVQQNSQRLGKNASTHVGSFFVSLTPLTGTFDPKVIYDQYNGRFVVVTLERTTSPSNTSRILVAVSQTSDPNSGWYFTSINSVINISGFTWADYPGLAVTDDAILITNNMFTFSGNIFRGSRLWIIQKSSFYTGGVATVNIYDPSSDVSISQNFTMQPAHMFGTLPSGIKSYLVASGWSFNPGGIDAFSVITIGGSSTSPTFTNTFVSHLSDIHNTGVAFPEAPQLGTDTLINTPGNRVMNAVWRSNNLWAVNTINPPSGVDAGQATAHWYRMGTSGTISIGDQGNIGGEDIAVGTYTFYPSIAVNSAGDAIIGFAASAPTIYCGAYYAGRYSTTPAGTILAFQVFKPGLDSYVRIFTSNGGTRNRWGDYSGSSVDPSDDETFYIFNEYALTRGTDLGDGELGRWGTAFGVVPVTALPVELSSFTAKVLRNEGVQLDWTTETEVNNYGFEVGRQVSSGQLTGDNWEKIAFLEGFGNSNSPKKYSFLDRGINYGNYAYRLKQIDNDGTFEYSDVIEVNAGIIPEGFVLEQNYPNPFNPSTVIKFALVESQQATLNVYDILGNEIAQLFNEITEAGKIYEIEFSASNLSSGIYYYRLSTPPKSLVRKMLLLR